MYANFGKRLFDVMLSLTGLLMLLPVMAVICVALLVAQGRPVFFRQRRPGRNARPFGMVKFRTMRNTLGSDGRLLADADRITSIGAFLRKTSLDELPELWNVLVGDMSLVGPRPLLMEYLPRYTPEQARRHEVRPGLTGLAQVSGRQFLPFSERLKKDVQYIDDISFLGDLRILIGTVVGVIKNRGVVIGQDVAEVDDIGLSVGLAKTSESSVERQ